MRGLQILKIRFLYSIILATSFQQCTQPLATFLFTLGLSSISFECVNTPQQEDGCSCGAFALAGVLAHANGTLFNHFTPRHVTCFRSDMCHSIQTGTLIMHFTLANRAQAKRKAPVNDDIMHKLLRIDSSPFVSLKRTLIDECQVSSQ